MSRVITGGPGTGKTTLAQKSEEPVRHTDDTIGKGWEPAIDEVAGWLGRPDTGTVEGVQGARALRKWLQDHPSGKPCDEVVWLDIPKERQGRGQAIMQKGINTVMREIEPELRRRGVVVKKER